MWESTLSACQIFTTSTIRSLPMRSIATDLWAGVLVGVVLVPTAMAFGVIAGLGPAAGLYGAIALGLLAAITGNTRGLISGPNIFVAIVLASVVSEHGLAAGFTAALVSGVFLIAFGLTRLGRFIVYIPHSLLSGFFTAAGIVLVVTQVLPAIGLPPAPGGVVGSVKAWTNRPSIRNRTMIRNGRVLNDGTLQADGESWRASARKVKRALVLLKADEGMTDRDIASGLLISASTVGRVRTRFVKEELDSALNERPRPGQKRKLDGRQEAHLIAIACSDAPEGHADWTICLPTRWWRWGLPRASPSRRCARYSKKRSSRGRRKLHPGGERGVRGSNGGRAGPVPRRLRPGPSRGLFRRDIQATGGR